MLFIINPNIFSSNKYPKKKNKYTETEKLLLQNINHQDLIKQIKKVEDTENLIFKLKKIQKKLLSSPNKKNIQKLKKTKKILKELKKEVFEKKLLLYLLLKSYTIKYKKLTEKNIFDAKKIINLDPKMAKLYLKYAEYYKMFAQNYENITKRLEKDLKKELIKKLIKKEFIIKKEKNNNYKIKIFIKKFIKKLKQKTIQIFKKLKNLF